MNSILFGLQLLLLITNYSDGRNVQCPELSDKALAAILGTTFNARYMSIDTPPEEFAETGGTKRSSTSNDLDFFMDEKYENNPYEGIPAWEVDHVEIAKKLRKRREIPPRPKRDGRNMFMDAIMATPTKNDGPRKQIFQARPWECTSEVQWLDLGLDYFPRYIRSVQCIKKNCWYGHYTCKEKRLSVKVLRRITGQCAKVSNRLKIFTLDIVTGEYAQQWEFVEKAITFCCDCVMKY